MHELDNLLQASWVDPVASEQVHKRHVGSDQIHFPSKPPRSHVSLLVASEQFFMATQVLPSEVHVLLYN